jgi:hypothetical protein
MRGYVSVKAGAGSEVGILGFLVGAGGGEDKNGKRKMQNYFA